MINGHTFLPLHNSRVIVEEIQNKPETSVTAVVGCIATALDRRTLYLPFCFIQIKGTKNLYDKQDSDTRKRKHQSIFHKKWEICSLISKCCLDSPRFRLQV